MAYTVYRVHSLVPRAFQSARKVRKGLGTRLQSAAVHVTWSTPDCNFWLFRLSSLALLSGTWMYACSMVVNMYMGTCSWNGHMHACNRIVSCGSPCYCTLQLHYNMQAEKQGMVARSQTRQNVGRCRDGENVFKVSEC